MTRMTRNMRYLPLIAVVTMFALIAATCHTDEPAVSSEESSESTEAEEEFRLRIIERAQEWLPIDEDGVRDTSLNYSQEDDSGLGGYRADCSGYINYAWDIPEFGTAGGLNTEKLMKFGDAIPINDLAAGDILVSNPINGGSTNHGLIFVEWSEKDEGSFIAYEQNGFYKRATRRGDLLLYECGENSCRIRGQGDGNWGPYHSYIHPDISEIRASIGLTLVDPVLADSPSLETLAAEQGSNNVDQCLLPLELLGDGEALIPEPLETELAPLDRMDSISVVQWIDFALQTGDISIFDQLINEQLNYANYIEGGQLIAKQEFLHQLSSRWTDGPYCEAYTSDNGALRIWTGGWSPPWEMTELCYDGCHELNPPWQSETAAFFLSETSDGWAIETLWLNDRSYWEGLPFTSCDQAQLSNTEEAGAGEPEIIEGLAGVWEGTAEGMTDGGFITTREVVYEIKAACPTGEYCLFNADLLNPQPWVESKEGRHCFGDPEIHSFCFTLLSDDTVLYEMWFVLASESGTLTRSLMQDVASPDAALDRANERSVLVWLVRALNEGDDAAFEHLLLGETIGYGTGFAGGRSDLSRTDFLNMLEERIRSSPMCEAYSGDEGYLTVWTSNWEPDWQYAGAPPSDVLTLSFMDMGDGLALVTAYFTPAPDVLELPSVDSEPCPDPQKRP